MPYFNFLNFFVKYHPFYGDCPRGSSLSEALSNHAFAYESIDSALRSEVENPEAKMNFNSGEFLSDSEVVLRAPKDADLCHLEAGLPTISGKPILFSTTHPKKGFKYKDPKTVFNPDIISAGTIDNAWIDYTCQSQIRAKIFITDPEIRVLISQRNVFLSYAFWRASSLSASFSFDFDHLLIFQPKVVCK